VGQKSISDNQSHHARENQRGWEEFSDRWPRRIARSRWSGGLGGLCRATLPFVFGLRACRGARYSHRPCALLGLGAHDPAHTYVVGERIIRQRLRDAVDLIVISALRKHQQLRFKLGQKWRISRK